jgi:hypothetical protein
MKTFKKDWKLGAAVGTALSLGSAGAIAGPHGFDLHNVLNGASASMAGTSIAHTEDPVSALVTLQRLHNISVAPILCLVLLSTCHVQQWFMTDQQVLLYLV